MRRHRSMRRKFLYRAAEFLVVMTATVAIASEAGVPSASASTGPERIRGGMVHVASGYKPPAAPRRTAASYPSCDRIEYVGNAGYIAVQEKNHRLQWGIVMTPLADSIGKWDVNTYLSGKKTTSGFHRSVTVGYIPHGSLAVPANKIFHVQAEVVGPHGTAASVPNACRT